MKKLSVSYFVLFLLISCSKKTGIEKIYFQENFNKDKATLIKILEEEEYNQLTHLLDSLPNNQTEGRSYADIISEKEVKQTSTLKRFTKRFMKKNNKRKGDG